MNDESLLGWGRSVLRNIFGEEDGPAKRVFLSFDYDNDRNLKDLFVGQTLNEKTPFEIVNHSLKEAAPDDAWEKRARAAISKSEVMLILLGTKTHKAHGVLKEVRMAKELGIPMAQIIVGHSAGTCKPVEGGGRKYAWTHSNLSKILR